MLGRLLRAYNEANMRLARATLYPSSSIRWLIAIVYCALHFIGGFFTIWLLYNTLIEGYSFGTEPQTGPKYGNSAPELDQVQSVLLEHIWLNGFGYKSGIETLYLVLCVIWGNIGWDRVKNIFNDENDRKFYRYFVLESFLLMSLMAMGTAGAVIWLEFIKGVWWPTRNSNYNALISVGSFMIIVAAELIRAIWVIPRKLKLLSAAHNKQLPANAQEQGAHISS